MRSRKSSPSCQHPLARMRQRWGWIGTSRPVPHGRRPRPDPALNRTPVDYCTAILHTESPCDPSADSMHRTTCPWNGGVYVHSSSSSDSAGRHVTPFELLSGPSKTGRGSGDTPVRPDDVWEQRNAMPNTDPAIAVVAGFGLCNSLRKHACDTWTNPWYRLGPSRGARREKSRKRVCPPRSSTERGDSYEMLLVCVCSDRVRHRCSTAAPLPSMTVNTRGSVRSPAPYTLEVTSQTSPSLLPSPRDFSRINLSSFAHFRRRCR